MNVDLAISLSIFLISISIIVMFSTRYFSSLPIWKRLGELREIAMEVKDKLFSEKGVMNKIYRIQILVEETAGLARENEPIEIEVEFDGDCVGKALNTSLRIQDENLEEIGYEFMNQTFCFGNYLKSAKLRFNVNISAFERKKYQIFYHNFTVISPSYNVTLNTSSWIPNNGDSWTESTTNWIAYEGAVGLDNVRKAGDYSINASGSFANGKIGMVYDPGIITGVENGWYLRAWIWVDNASDLKFFVNLSDGSENISREIDLQSSTWNLFEEEINSSWQGWVSFNASKGIDFVSFYATNQTAGISRTLRIDGLRFEKKPLKVTVFPEEEVEVISREKLEEWRNKSAEELIGMLGKGYKVRIEIRGME